MQERLIEEKKKDEEKELSFKPKLNKKTEELANKRKQKDNLYTNIKIEDRLIALGKNQKEKQRQIITENEINKYNNNKYIPTIPESSEQICEIKRKNRLEELQSNFNSISFLKKTVDNNKENHNDSNEEYHNTNQSFSFEEDSSYNQNNSDIKLTKFEMHPDRDIHDYLYLEAKIKEKRQQEYSKKVMAQICPFKPTIHEYKSERTESTKDFYNRISQPKDKKENEIIICKKNSSEPKYNPQDYKTKIYIKRSSKERKIREDRAIINQNIQNEKKTKEKKKNLEDKKKLFLEQSKEIIYKMKIDRLKNVFDKLDSDADGIISSSKIQLSELDHEILQAITPLLKELQDTGNQITFKDFCLKADKLINIQIFPFNL